MRTEAFDAIDRASQNEGVFTGRGSTPVRPYGAFSDFALEILYKKALKSFSEDLRSPARLTVDGIRSEFSLRGIRPPDDALTRGYLGAIRELVRGMVEQSPNNHLKENHLFKDRPALA